MIDLSFFSGLPVAVLGLGMSGLSAARALQASGAQVWAWDDDEARRAAARDQEVPIVDLTGCNWSELTSLVLSPGIPHSHPAPHPVAELARAHNCEIIGDIELLGRAQPAASFIGVTGTNGKSTTTALIGHILETGGREVQVGGNLGVPALELEPLSQGAIYVLEMSSYQLELTRSITFDVAVLLNMSPDHTERHGGFAGYVAAKRLIFHRQTRPRTAVIGIDDETCRGIHAELAAADEQFVVPVSGAQRAEGGAFVSHGTLFDAGDGEAVPALDLSQHPHLPGVHNWQNAAAAYAACKAVGLSPPVIAACLRSFPGLPHRQELLEVIDGIAYVNDSKATNADAAAKALACYERIYWILGGRAKTDGLAGLKAFYPRVAHAFLIGEAEAAFAAELEGQLPISRCGTLDRAVTAAAELARGETAAVVLLSPACASFDQFDSFEARGERFRALVAAVPGERGDPELPAMAPPAGGRLQ